MTLLQAKNKPNSRHIARIWAMQALFKLPYGESASSEFVGQEFLEDEAPHTPGGDVTLFRELVNGVMTQCEAIDVILGDHIDRPLLELTPVELTILRIAVFELCYRPVVPYRVVINEALELTKTFG